MLYQGNPPSQKKEEEEEEEIYRAGTSNTTLLCEGFVISDLFITRFHCNSFDKVSILPSSY